jgi:hypothetical protein
VNFKICAAKRENSQYENTRIETGMDMDIVAVVILKLEALGWT